MQICFDMCSTCHCAKQQFERNLSLIQEISSLGNDISLDISFLTSNSVLSKNSFKISIMKGKQDYHRTLEPELLAVHHGIAYFDMFNEKAHFTVENFIFTFQ